MAILGFIGALRMKFWPIFQNIAIFWQFWTYFAYFFALMALIFVGETSKWVHIRALLHTVILIYSMPIICENCPNSTKKYSFWPIFAFFWLW